MKDNEKQKERESILAEVDNLIDEDVKAADTAEAEISNAATVPSKFKDYKTLLKAYTDLEAEFTRRSQRLKELEANKEQTAPVQAANATTVPSQQAETAVTEEMKNSIIEEYLNGVCNNRGVPFVTGGGAVTAARRTPSTLREAGALAKNLFENKEDK